MMQLDPETVIVIVDCFGTEYSLHSNGRISPGRPSGPTQTVYSLSVHELILKALQGGNENNG